VNITKLEPSASREVVVLLVSRCRYPVQKSTPPTRRHVVCLRGAILDSGVTIGMHVNSMMRVTSENAVSSPVSPVSDMCAVVLIFVGVALATFGSRFARIGVRDFKFRCKLINMKIDVRGRSYGRRIVQS